MRCCYAILALCSAPAAPSPTTRGVLQRVLMHMVVSDPIEHFSGTFYGVRAEVDLNMRTRVATVALSGAVLGGRVSGTGWLKRAGAESGGVILDAEFERRLRRRFVQIRHAALNREERTVTVYAKVPVIGAIKMVLK